MMMPEMTGMELIETLNDNPSLTPSVIFLLTAHDSAGVREIAHRLNVKDVIAKPAHPEQICELISQTVNELQQSKGVDTDQTIQDENKEPYSETRHEELNVNQLLWEVAKKFQSQADIKDQLLVVGKTEPDLKVHGNAAQLRQALRTLVWSAINNTPKGGSVILSSENGSDMVRVLVRDTGYGDEGLIDHESFGQDLAVVKSIAEAHGGAVTVESEIGKGTCFVMSLPILPKKEDVNSPLNGSTITADVLKS
jgi:signal transduction histidine kinase